MAERKPRILVVEDETLIAVYLQEILDELGCEVVGPVRHDGEALEHARNGVFDAAVLNLVIEGKKIYSVVEVLAARGVPFGFASGVPRDGLDGKWRDRPFLDKPFEAAGVRAFVLELLDGMDLPLSPDQRRRIVSVQEAEPDASP